MNEEYRRRKQQELLDSPFKPLWMIDVITYEKARKVIKAEMESNDLKLVFVGWNRKEKKVNFYRESITSMKVYKSFTNEELVAISKAYNGKEINKEEIIEKARLHNKEHMIKFKD